MTAREKAIEAGLEAAESDPRWRFNIYPTGWAEVEDILNIAAPYIESALLDRIEEKIRRVLTIEHGIAPGQPIGRSEWGPDCAGCGAKEYRIDGFCSPDCRDRSELAFDVLTILTEIREETGE